MKISGTARANVKLWASAAVFVMCGSLALAQSTLPLPTPGTNPAAPCGYAG